MINTEHVYCLNENQHSYNRKRYIFLHQFLLESMNAEFHSVKNISTFIMKCIFYSVSNIKYNIILKNNMYPTSKTRLLNVDSENIKHL